MAISYPYRFLRMNPKLRQNNAFNNQILKHICHHNGPTPFSDNLQKLKVGFSLIKIFVRQPLFVGDITKGTSKTCQYVPGLTKDRSHPSLSLATLCSTTIHKVGKLPRQEVSKKGSFQNNDKYLFQSTISTMHHNFVS